MTWYMDLKFEKNPLDIRPNPNLVGLKKEEKDVINHILKEDICFLNGLTGSGKTSLLKRIQRVLKNHEFIYLDAHDLPQRFSLEKELKKKRSFFDKLALREYPKEKPVLIIDEFQATDPRLVLNARSKWEDPDKRVIKSIVIAQISKHLDNCTKSFKERISSRTVELTNLNNDELKEILKRRLYNSKLKRNFVECLSDETLDLIVKCSGKNPRRLLEYTDMIFDYHHRKFGNLNPIMRNDYKISYYAGKEILNYNNVYVEDLVKKADEKKASEQSNESQSTGMIKDDANQRLSNLSNNCIDDDAILKYIDHEPRTLKDIAKNFSLPNNTVKKKIDSLRKKGHVVGKGKKGRMNLWELSPETKRLLVDV